jgi:PEP-CTERM motif
VNVGSFFGTFLIAQGGNLYTHSVPLSTITGVFQNARANNLAAGDFSLVTDLTSGTKDTTKHPDFAGSELQFGVLAGWVVTSSGTTIPAHTTDIRIDNLSLNLTPVPEPASWLLVVGGGLLMGLARFRKFRFPLKQNA